MNSEISIDLLKEADQQLRLIASVFEHSHEGIIITDADRHILRVNPAFERTTGYSAEACIGQTPAILRSGWHDASFYKGIWDTVAREGAWQGEVWDRRRDGQLYVEWLTISAVRDESGAITNYIGIFFDITDKKAAEEHVTRLAYFDSLTGLANRRLFEDRLSHAIEAARRNGRPLALLFIDLDRFKPVNDKFGHKSGDLLLKQVAQAFESTVRDADTLARLGGDEFALLLEGSAQDQAAYVARRLLRRLDQTFVIEQREILIGASIGISVMPDDGDTMDSLLGHADVAMYRAKRTGGGYQFFSAEMTRGATERLALEQALHHAIDRDELELQYQPRLDLRDGALRGLEVRPRWHQSERGLIAPERFLPLAEATGLSVELGAWALEAACRDRHRWRGHIGDEVVIALTVSAKQLSDRLPRLVAETLAHNELLAEQLELEVAASLLAKPTTAQVAVLRSLSAMGVRLTMSELGAGCVSLGYLTRLPFQALKLDGALIAGLPDNNDDLATLRAIVAMAKSLDLRLIAAGVETAAQAEVLIGQGCDAAQGRHYAEPSAIKDFF